MAHPCVTGPLRRRELTSVNAAEQAEVSARNALQQKGWLSAFPARLLYRSGITGIKICASRCAPFLERPVKHAYNAGLNDLTNPRWRPVSRFRHCGLTALTNVS
jgi:hypothetical protein